MRTLFHITTREESLAAAERGSYEPAGFAQEGFVHCSFLEQVAATAKRIFGGRRDLVLLVIDPARLDGEVVEENLEGGSELFPHVYGPIRWAAVQAVHDLPCGEDGSFSVPATAPG